MPLAFLAARAHCWLFLRVQAQESPDDQCAGPRPWLFLQRRCRHPSGCAGGTPSPTACHAGPTLGQPGQPDGAAGKKEIISVRPIKKPHSESQTQCCRINGVFIFREGLFSAAWSEPAKRAVQGDLENGKFTKGKSGGFRRKK